MKKIEIDTFLKFQFVSNPSFSPDGKYIAFVVSNADRAENTYKANLYVYDMAEKKVRKLSLIHISPSPLAAVTQPDSSP